MLLRVGIENNNDNRSIAWALEHPGCFAYGQDAAEAERNMTQAAQDYTSWVRAHGMTWMNDGLPEIKVEEAFDAYRLSPDPDQIPVPGAGALIESFFLCDGEPLNGTDIERSFKLLDWSRQDLLRVVKGLSDQQLNEEHPGERWSINGILLHVAHAEWWYQERVGSPFPEHEDDLPSDPPACLELVRAHFSSMLPKLEGVHQALDVEGEIWSPRKMLRRALWHERDHTQHIRKLR